MGEVLVTYLRVNSNITTEKIARTIGRFLNNTVLGPDQILNKVLKAYRLLIAFQLADIAKVYFIIGYYLRLRKAITIYILYKEDKIDYLFLKSYRPIALKNNLSKIFKRVVVDCIADIAKEYSLLLQIQIGARKNHLILLVLIVLATIIKLTWAMHRDYIVLILSLNINSIYNNIPHKYLLYIFRAKGFLK